MCVYIYIYIYMYIYIFFFQDGSKESGQRQVPTTKVKSEGKMVQQRASNVGNCLSNNA